MVFVVFMFLLLVIFFFNVLFIVDVDIKVILFILFINWVKMLVFDLKIESLGFFGVLEILFFIDICFFCFDVFLLIFLNNCFIFFLSYFKIFYFFFF